MSATGEAARVARSLQEHGYAVLEGFLTPEQVEELREEADTLFELAEDERQRGSEDATDGAWGHAATASCIYETLPAHRCTPELRSNAAAYREARCLWPLRAGAWRTLFASQLTALVVALLGSRAVLFNDQYIIKPPGASLAAFPWHRDSDWCRTGRAHYQPYISVWCALDDGDASNGCLVVLPGSQMPSDVPCAHAELWQRAPPSAVSSPAAGAAAANPAGGAQQAQGVALEVRAGTVVVTSDSVLHCSGPNRTRHVRRAWMPQFSAAPLTWRDTGACVSLAVPLAGGD